MTSPESASSTLHPVPAAPSTSGLGLILRGVWTVLEFEFKKSRTWKRMLVWAGVSLFPAVIISLMLFAGDELPRAGWVSAVFVMACEVVVILNAMLWVAPIVQTELEGKTWLYIVTRPYGRFCLVLGKLLNGLGWTLGGGLLAIALVGGVGSVYAMPLKDMIGIKPEEREMTEEERQIERARQLVHEIMADEHLPPEPPFESISDAAGIAGLLAVLAVLAGLTYSSLFCGIGCIIPKRAMLVAFSYTLVFETVVAFVPAIINRLTIQYHLRCLLNRWVDLGVPQEGQDLFFSDWPAWWHVSVLTGMIVVWQIVSLLVIHFRQYVMTDET